MNIGTPITNLVYQTAHTTAVTMNTMIEWRGAVSQRIGVTFAAGEVTGILTSIAVFLEITANIVVPDRLGIIH